MDGSVTSLASASRDAEALWAEASGSLASLYGEDPAFGPWLQSLRRMVDKASSDRSSKLKAWDREHAKWWLSPKAVGYSAYVDRLGGDFNGVSDALTYLNDLGVSYLHLLPLMKPRAGESDGGYAIADFEDVNPALGSLADFKRLLDDAHAKDIKVVVDLVCNHVADDHAWAEAARRGDPERRAFFHVMPDRATVDLWEADLDEVFPASAPGNFTWSEDLDAWVWTSFYPYQWDLNYANRDVFLAMTSTLLNLANQGVSGFRLDSTGFLWKRLGTTCRNLPQVHLILAAWRALLSIAAPGVVLKAEAIDRLEEVIPFLGTAERPECDLAYANGVMAAGWAALALGAADPLRSQIDAAASRPQSGAWINYVRCHDDIIFGALRPRLSSEDQARVAKILTSGEPGRFGDGEVFQTFDGVPSVNGMTASLCGVPADPLGVARHTLLYGIAFGLDGLPVIYMGDEIGLTNDVGYREDPARAGEGRWLQRPQMDWDCAEAAAQGTGASRPMAIAAAMSAYVRQRGAHAAFRDPSPAAILPGQAEAVLAFTRGASADRLTIVANVSSAPADARLDRDASWRDILTGRTGVGPVVKLAPYEILWLEAGA